MLRDRSEIASYISIQVLLWGLLSHNLGSERKRKQAINDRLGKLSHQGFGIIDLSPV